MDSIVNQHKKLKKEYDKGGSPLDEIKNITITCLNKLSEGLSIIDYGITSGKSYVVYSDKEHKSRPIDENLLITDSVQYAEKWDKFICSIDSNNHVSTLKPESDINKVIYTTIISFCACYDIWKNKSRKTPGTHFEVILGSILSQFLPEFTRSKFIILPDQKEKVSTDIVFDNGSVGLVIPAKITTRERIVQPYAHQRILDSVFGANRYKSILLCVSETQRDDTDMAVNDICVPGSIKLFQAHLSSLAGLYYIDPPSRYMQEDITNLISIGDYTRLLSRDLHILAD